MATDEGCRLGAPMPIATLALTQLIDSGGTYPQQGSGPATNVMGQVHTFAGTSPAYGALICDGRLLKVITNQPLFSVIYTSYGGMGDDDFGLPQLRQRIAVGGGPHQPPMGLALPMTYMIATSEAFASDAYPMIGAIGLFGGLDPPAGWLVADGSRLALAQYVSLFEAIGTTFGGDGASYIQLPDLLGRAAVGAGQGPSVSIALGQQVDAGPDTQVSCLGLNYIINISGGPPPTQGNGGFPSSASMLGEVVAYAGSAIPSGWLPADGREMSVEANAALFAVIGATFGGDGKVSFALPDLRTRLVEGGLS